MELKRYLFDSPSPSQVQVGKLDTSAKKEESVQKENTAPIENISNGLKRIIIHTHTS